jgi:thiopurine S-methyltransferase
MDRDFWRTRWQSEEIGFHQTSVNDLLQTYWPRLGLQGGAHVFVPLCGKSLDMAWLAGQGNRVMGVELSEIAVDAFFAERGLEPAVRTAGGFIVKSAGPYELWCGDIFELPRAAVANVAGVYDRAALIAFPPAMQERYAATLEAVLPARAPILLVTLDYDPARMQGPPFSVPETEVRRLFADHYDVELIADRSALERNVRFKDRGLKAMQECAYVLRRRA